MLDQAQQRPDAAGGDPALVEDGEVGVVHDAVRVYRATGGQHEAAALSHGVTGPSVDHRVDGAPHRTARLAGVPIDHVLTGKYPGTCPPLRAHVGDGGALIVD